MGFFDHINYAASHEDGRSERRALALDASSRVLCITGSGSRVLDLLLDAPREVVAIDLNPAQTHLLALKLVAIEQLGYDDYVRFLGLVDGDDRITTYTRLRPLLADDARVFWDHQSSALRRGVLYCGRWERFLRLMVAPAAWARRQLIARLFACRSLDEQASLWTREWNTPGWDRYLRVLANRWVWTKLVREPGMRHIPTELDIVATIKARFDRAAASTLFRESPWCWLVFRGALEARGPLPPHLQRENFERQRAATSRVTRVTASLLSYLRDGEVGSFSAFSLSDFGSYADDATYRNTWRALAHVARPGARVCERQFLVPRDPAALPDVGFHRERALEADLAAADDSVVYTLLAGTLPGAGSVSL